MSERTQQDWADKIAKLLLKAERASTPEEAEAFYGKAQELMSKYAIDEHMLRHAGGDQKNEITEEEFPIVGIYRFPLNDLCRYVLMANDLQQFRYQGNQPREVGGKLRKECIVRVAVGYKNDIDRARLLYTSLELQALSAMTAWSKLPETEYLFEMLSFEKGNRVHQEKRQFMESFALGVYQKLAAAKARGEALAEEEHGKESVALVVRDKSLAVIDFFKSRHPDIKPMMPRRKGGTLYAHEAGHQAGLRANTGDPALQGDDRRHLRQ